MIGIKQRKGALELSMNTIVVIVIAAIVLSLGIVFVKSMFGKVSEFGDQAFEKAEGSIGDITTYNGLITLSPGDISVGKGKAKPVTVIVANKEYNKLTFELKTKSSDPKLKCILADTMAEVSDQYSLESGEEASVKLIVGDRNGVLGMKVCSVELVALQGTPQPSDSKRQITVDVVKD